MLRKNTFLVQYCLSNLVSSKKAAFTLAEVLITLGIIGIVAAMTIPTLISEYKDRTYLASLKKLYANLLNSQILINAEYGLPSSWQLSSVNSDNNDANTKIAQYYADKIGGVSKFCGFSSVHPFTLGCVSGSVNDYKTLNGLSEMQNNWYNMNGLYHYTYQYALKDGSTVAILFKTNANGGIFWEMISNQIVAIFVLDVNGNAKPNRIGKDIYFLMLKDDKLQPSPYSKGNDNITFEQSDCSKTGLGYSCAYYIMQNGWKFPDDY